MRHSHLRLDFLNSSFGKLLLGLCLFLAVLIGSASNRTYSQDKPKLKPDQPITFTLAPGEEKSFILELKENDFADIFWLANESLNLSLSLHGPKGNDLVEGVVDIEDSIPFVASENGEYLFVVKLNKTEEIIESQKITLQYSDKLKLPLKITSSDVRKINGYDVKILKSTDEGKSYLLIEKNGRLKKVVKGSGFMASGFNFSDDLTHTYSVADKKAAILVKNTVDKTGDGTPDVAIEYFSGGAHCCFTLLFFELGETVKEIPQLSTANAQIRFIGRSPKGGLLLETFDDTFAYWLTSFADSPMAKVVLEFQKGAFRPNFQLMKKPAPSLIKLRNMAREMRGKISLEPYKGVDTAEGINAVFWDVMLDLIYTGNEELAWQYLDLVWPVKKSGKAIFREDFKNQLSKSQFWQMIVEDNKLLK